MAGESTPSRCTITPAPRPSESAESHRARRGDRPVLTRLRFLPISAGVRLDLADEIDRTRVPRRREPDRDRPTDVPRIDRAVFDTRARDAFLAGRFRAARRDFWKLRPRADVRLRPALLPARRRRPVRRPVRARSSTVSRPTILLKLLFSPRPVWFCTMSARLLSSNFWNHSSHETSSREPAPL